MKKPTTSTRKQRKNRDEPLSRSVHAELSEFHRAYSVFRPAPHNCFRLFEVIFVLCNPKERSKSPRGTSVNLQRTFERLRVRDIPQDRTAVNAFLKEFENPQVDEPPQDLPPQTVTVSEGSLWSAGVELSSPAGPMFDASASSARASQRQLRLQEHFTKACQSASHLQRLIWTYAQPLFLLILEELDSNEFFPSAPPQRALLGVVTTRTVSTIGVSRSANAAISAGAGAGHGMTKFFALFRKEKHIQVEYDDLYGVSALRFIVFPIECLAQNKWRIHGGISVCDSEFGDDDDKLTDDTRNRDGFYRAQKWLLGSGELPHGTNNRDISKSHAVQRNFSPSAGGPTFFNRASNYHLDTDRQHDAPYVDVSRTNVPVPWVDIDITPFLNEFAEKQSRLASYYRKTASGDLEKLNHAANLLRSALRKCCFESTVRTLYDLSGCYLRGVGVDMELGTSKLLRYCASGLRRNYDSRDVWLSRLAVEFISYSGLAVERKVVSLALFSRPTLTWLSVCLEDPRPGVSIGAPPSETNSAEKMQDDSRPPRVQSDPLAKVPNREPFPPLLAKQAPVWKPQMVPSPVPRYRVFISHAQEDKYTIAKPLRERLQVFGITSFVDENDPTAGVESRGEMLNAMETADVYVAILSPEFVAWEWTMKALLCFLTRRELNEAEGRRGPVIIPFYYRLSEPELRSEPDFSRLDQTRRSLYVSSRFLERMEKGEPEADIANVKDALWKLLRYKSMESRVDTTNESHFVESHFVRKSEREYMLTEVSRRIKEMIEHYDMVGPWMEDKVQGHGIRPARQSAALAKDGSAKAKTSNREPFPPLHAKQAPVWKPQMVSSPVPRYRVFISHAQEDKDTIAIPLRERLLRRGIASFVDENEPTADIASRKEMCEAMETADVYVAVLSQEFMAWEWTMKALLCFLRRREINDGAGRRRPVIIPFFYRLSRLQIHFGPDFSTLDQDYKSLYLCLASSSEWRRANRRRTLQTLRTRYGNCLGMRAPKARWREDSWCAK